MIISGGAEPLVSAAGWIKGALDMLDQDEPETGRGSWGRDSELDDEPTLLHDSDSEKKKKIQRENIFNFLHFLELTEALDRRAKTSLFQLIRFEEVIANSSAICRGGKKDQKKYILIFTNI